MSSFSDVITLDFETKPIQSRPNFPPQPVGLAIKEGHEPGKYLAWGHAAGENNATEQEARAHLERAFASGRPLLFHNAYFDLAVAHEYFGFDLPDWDRVHDTAILAFLVDPHGLRHDLKGLAEDHLNWAPEERDAIGEWAWEHRQLIRDEYGLNPSRSKGKVTKVWQYYWIAPGDLAGKYAVGDVDRTFGLFKHWVPVVHRLGMSEAYNREREVAPIFYQNEIEGIRVDREQLESDVIDYENLMEYVEDELRERLGDQSLNFDADADVAEALSRNGIVRDEDWTLTKNGQKSVSKKVLKKRHYQDEQVYNVLGYRNRLKTALEMFMKPWAEQSGATGGWIHTHWNTTRGGSGGTRTGRPSTYAPNFLNISKDFENNFEGWEHPEFLLGEQRLPLVRKYIVADTEDHIILHRDFSGQELRIFGHYESGPLLEAYKRDPKLDVHDFVGERLKPMLPPSINLTRTKTKVCNFQSIYGGGAPALANELDIDLAEAKAFKAFHDKALPGRVVLNQTITRMVRRGIPIRTWGGRCYLPEPPKDGRSFEYKLINYLVQGSAADITKQAMIDWHKHPDREARFLLQVYDELNVVAHKDVAAKQMQVLRETMEKDRIDVKMLSDGKYGYSWGELTKGDPA
jgi:DNA polymerase I-like protein with 3'-5' exonuclease and polymerase domains